MPRHAFSYGLLRLPKGTPSSLAFASNTTLLVGSTDHTVVLFNLKSGEVIRRFRGHRGIVNSVDVQKGSGGKGLFVTGSDDGTVRVWSEDSKGEMEVIELGYPITSVSHSQATSCQSWKGAHLALARPSNSRLNGPKMGSKFTSVESTTTFTCTRSPPTPSPTPSVPTPTQSPLSPSRLRPPNSSRARWIQSFICGPFNPLPPPSTSPTQPFILA